MIVSKVQKKTKLKKVTVVSAQASAVKTAALPKTCAQNQVRERAFEILERRGSQHGHDLEDWFRAVHQIHAQ
jgi:hypothetical protein